MIESWIVEPLAVGDQGAEDRADLSQLIPIAIVAREAGGIEAKYQTCASQTNLGEQILEAASRKRVGA